MENCKEISHCRLCGSDQLFEAINLGETPPANALVSKENLEKPEQLFPLVAVGCRECGCIQLKHSVSAPLLFSNYLYTSSTSASFRKHFEDYAKTIVGHEGLKKGDLVIDIGSNDNILLKPFRELGMNVIGVEPATNIVNQIKDDGIQVFNNFFTPELAFHIRENFGYAKVITANNVFAHIDNLDAIVNGIKILLDPDGVFVFENAYLLDTINNLYFDQLYHEHIFYHSIKPLRAFFRKHGLEIFEVQRNTIQGGTIRVFVRRAYGQYLNWSTVENLLEQEEEAGLYKEETYRAFQLNINKLKEDCINLLNQLKSDGKTIAAYSYPAKATTLSNFYNIGDFKFVVEDAKMKQGFFTPKFHVPIVDKEYLKQNPVDYLFILAWNFKDVIIANNPDFKGKWICPLPSIQII